MAGRLLRFSDYQPKAGEYFLLLSDLPGHGTKTIGVVLLDQSSDSLHIRLRRDWHTVGEDEDIEVLAELEDDLRTQERVRGGSAVFEWLQDGASQALRVSDREAVTVRDFTRALNDLYREHVPTEVLPFRTHLPRFSLAVAAGPFLTNPEDVTAEDWIEVPDDLRLDDNMFVARIQGHSMEPMIPDGSLCVFRRNVVGSRQNRLVLVRNSELADDNQYTVKRYKSEKQYSEEGFVQTRIRLESLNPAYPSWDLDEDAEKYQVVAEFVSVLD
ncbi:MAG TPA: S24 family peptidase [Bryobacteraceae bacterium]|nr:S24 family peptidase [Bryobacteraceae bacterium]